MSTFKPFANDSQVLTLTAGVDELSFENGTEEILLSGTMTLRRDDPETRANVLALQAALAAILDQLG